MAVLNEADLKERIKTRPIGIYLIYGEESYLKKVYVEKIVSKTVDKVFADFNYRVFDGENVSLSDVYDYVVSAPFGAQTRCAVVKDFPLDALDDGGFKGLEALLSDAPAESALIFCFLTCEPKGAKWNGFRKLFEERGGAFRLDKRTSAELARILENGAKKRGVSFGAGVAAHMVSCVGNDLNSLLNEMEKLRAYVGGGEIKKSDVDAVCVKNLDARVFDMARDLLAGRPEPALKKLRALFERREDEFQILGALTAVYSDIYRVKAAERAGLKSGAVAKYYNYTGKEFRLRNAARDAARLTFGEIDERVGFLMEADAALKSLPVDKKLILEQTIIKLAGAGGEKK